MHCFVVVKSEIFPLAQQSGTALRLCAVEFVAFFTSQPDLFLHAG